MVFVTLFLRLNNWSFQRKFSRNRLNDSFAARRRGSAVFAVVSETKDSAKLSPELLTWKIPLRPVDRVADETLQRSSLLTTIYDGRTPRRRLLHVRRP